MHCSGFSHSFTLTMIDQEKLHDLAKDIIMLKFKGTETLDECLEMFYDLMRKHGIKLSYTDGQGETLLTSFAWTLCKSTFINTLNSYFTFADILKCPKDLFKEQAEKEEDGTMDIYAKEGTKVRYTGKNGYDSQIEHANKYLTIGEIYTVYYTDVSGFSTTVYLKEVPNKGFNSVHFENVS